MRTCKYITSADVPDTYMTLSKCVKKENIMVVFT